MSQKIVTLCDICQSENEDHPAVPLQIAIDGGGARVVDLCDDHRAELVEDLLSALAEFSRPSSAPGIAPGKGESKSKGHHAGRPPFGEDVAWTCPVCDWPTTGGRGAARSHVRKEHNTELAMIEKFGVQQAMEGAGVRYICDVGKCKEEPRRFTATQGIAQHLRSTHGMTLDEARETTLKLEVHNGQERLGA